MFAFYGADCTENRKRKKAAASCVGNTAARKYTSGMLLSVTRLDGVTSAQLTRSVELSNRRCTSPRFMRSRKVNVNVPGVEETGCSARIDPSATLGFPPRA